MLMNKELCINVG